MEFNQCPLSIPDQNTYDVIELILTAEETGIPVTGTCLLNQTKKYFEWRRIIMNERAECFNELHKKDKKQAKEEGIQKKPVLPTRARIGAK